MAAICTANRKEIEFLESIESLVTSPHHDYCGVNSSGNLIAASNDQEDILHHPEVVFMFQKNAEFKWLKVTR
jgi:hypothetical protein